MSKDFEIVVEGEFPGDPEQMWDAITQNTAAWLFPTDDMPGVDLVSERPTHHVNRMEGPDGWFNQLEQVIEPRPGGHSFLRWVHSGVIQDDWDNQYDSASKHTLFYLHTLSEYLEHFAGRSAVYADVQGPEASGGPEGFETLRSALGLTPTSAVGETVTVALPGVPAGTASVDWNAEHFIGLRTADGLYRFFGRNAFGAVVGLTVHRFGDIGSAGLPEDWKTWLDALYG
ncbi:MULTISPECIES: SRPBCC domain-containing protein [unclassified Cryobacterium]|uniref:SRPBCC domain-containing protein n=1 Tax=unclassified Cryobacterium TaxID=2649013 RepID=UPI00106D079F|nr:MULTISPECIES: SRPBCC domain-containing protein [unclassified Cryobacterium]TFC00311.1 SRPBCC domain-containing protein [Cryobacterium sp. MDB2-A-1]TFC13366.1 SRPBCC domain-containing protein [Cryobacterium sp. MDB2-10]TFC14175.1 SRPBCC domain-containing protein [Cryobacterium sp. MDB2-A-2]TFC32752.1 SRPBCC domain-containing protein [Cryobacterium sp. MDB1-18-2]TFC44496.1 SRPBCC domain-containing protein [Cryobacterium sp. MDB1-18-1]